MHAETVAGGKLSLTTEVHATATWLDTAAGTWPSGGSCTSHSVVEWYLYAFAC